MNENKMLSNCIQYKMTRKRQHGVKEKHLIEKELTQANNARPLLDSWNSFDQLNTRLHGGINTGKGEEK